jgi:ribonuclease P protein component
MFKKTNRLTQSEFAHYFACGKRLHTKYFTVITSPSPSQKVAVVVGKKVAKSAVQRNLLRRRVYALLRIHCIQHSGILIVLVKPTFKTLTRKEAVIETTSMIAQVLKGA